MGICKVSFKFIITSCYKLDLYRTTLWCFLILLSSSEMYIFVHIVFAHWPLLAIWCSTFCTLLRICFFCLILTFFYVDHKVGVAIVIYFCKRYTRTQIKTCLLMAYTLLVCITIKNRDTRSRFISWIMCIVNLCADNVMSGDHGQSKHSWFLSLTLQIYEHINHTTIIFLTERWS